MARPEDEAFQRQLEATFKVEAQEHLHTISSGLIDLEKAPAPTSAQPIVETVFRAAHSLKGAARAVDFTRIESTCQSLEDICARWKRGERADPRSLDAAQRAVDAISAMLATPAAPAARAAEPDAVSAAAPAAAAVAPAEPQRPTSDPHETVRVAVSKLEARLLETEEMLTLKLASAQRVAELRELAALFNGWRESWAALQADARAVRQSAAQTADERAGGSLRRALDFIESGADTLKAIENRITTIARSAQHDSAAAGKLVDDLLEESKKLLLLPFATISAAFPKLVRELCRDRGKEADFTILGDDVEIDKRILEEMKDPIVHLLRNSVDHGIEPPDERARNGKPRRATIALALSQVEGWKVQILLSDDGAGIDSDKVKAAAVRRGLISQHDAEALGDDDAHALIFESALSTSPMITELSGRGLGLAIVREKAEKLGGEVSVQSRRGAGTTFRIVVPAMRATFRGILIEAAGRKLVIPTAQVETVTRAIASDVLPVEGRSTISLRDRALPLVRLADALELGPQARTSEARGGVPVVVVGAGDHRIAFAVDAVLDEQEMLVRPLRKPLSRVRNVAAATILGTGEIAPILNVADLLKSARKVAATATTSASPAAGADERGRRVLVAEDSITSRMLLKSILESGGYSVRTAVDGMEAFTLLRTEPFDVLVSDVEMPRLNGFDLTARVRADAKLAELPVVLVTALETREHRERGVDVGANAYLVKSSVDQSNLLDAVRRLV